MISVEEALSVIGQQVQPLPVQRTPLHIITPGQVLAEPIFSTGDMPPFDKAVMDGYAVRSADLPEGRGTLEVIEEIMAGSVPSKAVGPGQASRIMTGAPMPIGADAVIVVEMTQMEGGRVVIESKPPRPGMNVLARGGEMTEGEKLLDPGVRLRPQEIAILATVGRAEVLVVPRPRVAILCTGDELVEVNREPGPGQIRNSNGPMLSALTIRAGAEPVYLRIAPDRVDRLTALVQQGLRESVLVLSGGVSAGKLDLVPDVLRAVGVNPHFHKVAMKPGKPLFFGTSDAGHRTLVFGLPGNPVSALVGFELFVRPALRRLMGQGNGDKANFTARLTHDHAYRSDRPIYHPAFLEQEPTGWVVRLVPWLGSSDLRGLLNANALALLPPGDNQLHAGHILSGLSLDHDN
jgi:molybdopterin molybdotransferase